MLVSAGARRSGAAAGAVIRSTLHRPLHSQRQFSSFIAARNSQSQWRRAARNNSAFRGRSQPSGYPSLISSPRFISSSSSAATVTSATPETPVDNGVQTIEALSDGSNPALDLSQVPAKLGYLKELGLDYGFGPSSLIETLLESIHIYAGLPWWGSTIAAAVFIRVALFKFNLNASDMSAKLRRMQPITKPLQERMLKAVREGNNLEGLKLKQEMAMIREQHGVKMWKTFVPMLQIPLGFGFFRVLRGMSSLPVPGLLSEQFLWLNDITLSDPFFILPLVTGGSMYFAIKRGGETGMDFANSPLGKFMLYGLPVISTTAMSFWPAVLQLYFASTSLLALIQAYLVTSPGFRKLAGVEPLPSKAKPVGPNEPGASGSSGRIRVIPTTARVVPEAQQNPEQQVYSPQKVSVIDRTLDNVKQGFRDVQKQVQEKMDEMAGDKTEKNPDGTPKAPPRLSKQELENAAAYEKRRREQLEMERELRNQSLREEYMRKKQNIQ
ncbi:Mitochondrial inner membrane protein oxa1 [Coccidioides posadasii str. Silveira]|uniref:Membrane insertase YidC/Oxa/ALB C-terminal domain-containing protein n=2 Tax=Coccidioides posadasii TaxID=199306 RepID=E9DBD1_COCPS|nr:conserved hypothetical protein [Coccidioides posadasii str. Silveira]KMM67611.1 inner membrane protein oxaA [Coccidioides posadasii RMSCC 3488]QVM11546.1 Mitochondrial inner membrane protein oxa1 [Coccidioides posadasii str. Silveira]